MLCTVVSPRGGLDFVCVAAILDLDPADEPDPDPCLETGGDGSGSLRLSVNERFELICVVYGEGDRGERGGEKGEEGLGEIWIINKQP